MVIVNENGILSFLDTYKESNDLQVLKDSLINLVKNQNQEV